MSREATKDIELTCPVCRRKFTYRELVSHLKEAHPRSFWRIYLAELDVDEEERKMIFNAIKEVEKK